MIIKFEKGDKIAFGDLADKECFFSDGLLYIKIFSQDLKAFDIDCVNALSIENAGLTKFADDETVIKAKKSLEADPDSKYYKDYDRNCRQLGLSEVYKTTSKTQYEWFLRTMQEKNIICRGYIDDWNCKFEIRFGK